MATSNAQEQKDWARVAKYALNILMLAFPMGAIARSLSLGSLRHTVATALVLLLDDAVRGVCSRPTHTETAALLLLAPMGK